MTLPPLDHRALRVRGLMNQAPASTTSASKAGAMASQTLTAATAAAAAQPIEEKASAKVATREEIWRRRNWLRLAWVRNQSWIAVAAAAAMTIAAAGDQRVPGRGDGERRDERREDHGDDAEHGLDLGAQR